MYVLVLRQASVWQVYSYQGDAPPDGPQLRDQDHAGWLCHSPRRSADEAWMPQGDLARVGKSVGQ